MLHSCFDHPVCQQILVSLVSDVNTIFILLLTTAIFERECLTPMFKVLQGAAELRYMDVRIVVERAH